MKRWISLGAALLCAPLLAAFLQPSTAHNGTSTEPGVGEGALLGLWQATKPEKEGDPVRFYYFLNGGIGLVRYGRMGLTNTRAFQWKVVGSELALVFMKDGRHHRVPFSLEGERSVLHLPRDPAFPGNHRYTKDTRPRGLDFVMKEHPLARLWIETTRDRKGGEGFRMYQLQAPTIDGRGVGWYHEGDMTEWSTETLAYRRTGEAMELYFPVRDERFSSGLRIKGKGPKRTLSLTEDPRNFWHPRVYRDGGPGFTVALDGVPLPYHIPGHGPSLPLGLARAHRGCTAH